MGQVSFHFLWTRKFAILDSSYWHARLELCLISTHRVWAFLKFQYVQFRLETDKSQRERKKNKAHYSIRERL
jgi:hypothetical protein